MNIIMAGLFDPAKNDACKIHFYEVARAMARQGHEVTMLVPRCAPRSLPQEENLHLKTLPFAYSESLLKVLLLSIVQLAVHSSIVSGRTDAVYVRWRLLPALLFRLVHKLKGFSPIIVTEHNGWVEDEVRVQRGTAWMPVLARGLQRADARSADGVVAVVEGIAERLPPRARQKTVVVDNGTNTEVFHPLTKGEVRWRPEGLGQGPVIGFTGNISRWQGVDDLIRAFGRIAPSHPHASLVIAGSGPCLDELRRMASELPVADRIRFVGDVPYEAMNDWLNVFDLAVAPKASALDHIGYSPLKIRDYAAAGLAVAASRVRGIQELEPHGWLRTWDPADGDGLAELLDELLLDPDRLEQMGRKARTYAESCFSWEKAASAILTHIHALQGDKA